MVKATDARRQPARLTPIRGLAIAIARGSGADLCLKRVMPTSGKTQIPALIPKGRGAVRSRLHGSRGSDAAERLRTQRVEPNVIPTVLGVGDKCENSGGLGRNYTARWLVSSLAPPGTGSSRREWSYRPIKWNREETPAPGGVDGGNIKARGRAIRGGVCGRDTGEIQRLWAWCSGRGRRRSTRVPPIRRG